MLLLEIELSPPASRKQLLPIYVPRVALRLALSSFTLYSANVCKPVKFCFKTSVNQSSSHDAMLLDGQNDTQLRPFDVLDEIGRNFDRAVWWYIHARMTILGGEY